VQKLLHVIILSARRSTCGKIIACNNAHKTYHIMCLL